MARKKKPLPSLERLKPRMAASRAVCLGSFLALVLLIAIWDLLFADSRGAANWVPWLILGVKLLPLAIIAPGLLIGSARGHAWACYVVNLYFILGVLNAFEPNQRIYGWAELLLSVSLFCSALLYTRWRFQYDRKLAGED
ncbi:DUF2069 domain-containing protein [Pseudomonas panipatensis]|uniref:Uncharacterized membrane protein n=1 Tax=Pseudomonas panipatensis TaxID=428992 RepID=A0A1G8GQS4_9PSED|nr:DUF2069 domain-containing protein [Pseudomonas panipatensis]SDH96673.1 Uncharacterized membrane protein [Pseudomonas panipatensis]SMP41966.1 Uncharacterized membrane protein [Pseudomonas panipatensis]